MSSATERPSRAPSTTKSVMRATASGWLSLTPRSSRRRATIAAIAIKSLSFSRGVRFISFLLRKPGSRQSSDGGKRRDHIMPQRCAIGRNETHGGEAVPSGRADLAAKIERAHGADDYVRARRKQDGSGGYAAVCHGGHRKLARRRSVKPHCFRVGKQAIA